MTKPTAGLWSTSDLMQHWQGWLSSAVVREAVLSDVIPGSGTGPSRVTIRPVLIREQTLWQVTAQQGTQALHENLSTDELLPRLQEWLTQRFQDMRVQIALTEATITTSETCTGRRRRDEQWKISRTTVATSELPVVPQTHNRTKAYLIPEGIPCPFLAEIGVMNAHGKVLAAKYQKFRQINRFLELVAEQLPEWPADKLIRVVDFGSGKSYLTFALHHLLTTIRGWTTDIVGIDLKADVIADCSRIARKLGCAGLRFETGRIEDMTLTGEIDLVVSLHACDTATDAALAQAVRWNAPLVLAVPCCQHEFQHTAQPEPALTTLWKHGLLRERFSALATDACRAAVMELCGYQTQVVEFIDLEHTPKNVLLRCVKRPATPAHLRKVAEEYRALRTLLGIERPTLERLLADRMRDDGITNLCGEMTNP